MTSEVTRLAQVRTASAPPEHWTLVKDYNIEKRDDYESWKALVTDHLKNMRDQIFNLQGVITAMDYQIEKERRHLAKCMCEVTSDCTCTSTDGDKPENPPVNNEF